MAQGNVGAWQPDVGSATSLTQEAAQPISNGQINNYAGNYAPNVNQMGGALTAGVNQSTMGNAGAYSGQYGNTALGYGAAGTGALNAQTQGAIPGYLNPYTQNVVGGIESALNTNLMTNTLPQIESQFVSAGQSGSPQQDQAMNEAVYYNQQALGQDVAPALAQGYNTALGAAQGAANAGLGFGTQTAGTGLSAAQNATGTGYSLGATGYGGALQTALSEQGAEQAGGAQLGQLGALTSQLGNQDVSTVAASGSAQDTLGQANLNAAYNNFEQQEQWPYANLAYASDIIRGLPAPSSTSGTTGTTYNYPATTSPLQTGLGTTAIASALLPAKGGHIRRGREGALTLVSRPQVKRYQDGGSSGSGNSSGAPALSPLMMANPVLMALVNSAGADPASAAALKEFIAGQSSVPSGAGYRRGGPIQMAAGGRSLGRTLSYSDYGTAEPGGADNWHMMLRRSIPNPEPTDPNAEAQVNAMNRTVTRSQDNPPTRASGLRRGGALRAA